MELQGYTRQALEWVEPGVYLLLESGNPRQGRVYDASLDEWRDCEFTGRLLARVRKNSEVPTGCHEAWNRADGKAVVVIEEIEVAA